MQILSNFIVLNVLQFYRKVHSPWPLSQSISQVNVSLHVVVHHFLLESRPRHVLRLITFQSCTARVSRAANQHFFSTLLVLFLSREIFSSLSVYFSCDVECSRLNDSSLSATRVTFTFFLLL